MKIGDKIASIVAFFLPRRVKFYAMLDLVEWLPIDTMNIDCPSYTAHIEKARK